MRKTRTIAGIGLVVLGLAAGIFLWQSRAAMPVPTQAGLPPLAQGLPAPIAAGDRAFHRRLLERFPIGTPQAALAAELARQHFHVERTLASFSQKGAACNFIWTIFWTPDAQGGIRTLASNYATQCP